MGNAARGLLAQSKANAGGLGSLKTTDGLVLGLPVIRDGTSGCWCSVSVHRLHHEREEVHPQKECEM